MPDQANESFREPSREDIVRISHQHVAAMESSADSAIWVLAGMHHVLLHTVGRRSGNLHKVALPYWLDGDGHRIVVASFAGAPQDPAWFSNLSDRVVNPEVLVVVQDGRFWADPQILDGADYDLTWAQLTADRPYYNDYRSRTDRRIPLVRLVPIRAA